MAPTIPLTTMSSKVSFSKTLETMGKKEHMDAETIAKAQLYFFELFDQVYPSTRTKKIYPSHIV
jgi:hypothetical protein